MEKAAAADAGAAEAREAADAAAAAAEKAHDAAVVAVRRRVNHELDYPPNFERLVLGCIDADFCK